MYQYTLLVPEGPLSSTIIRDNRRNLSGCLLLQASVQLSVIASLRAIQVTITMSLVATILSPQLISIFGINRRRSQLSIKTSKPSTSMQSACFNVLKDVEREDHDVILVTSTGTFPLLSIRTKYLSVLSPLTISCKMVFAWTHSFLSTCY